jgi:hypothetical protein
MTLQPSLLDFFLYEDNFVFFFISAAGSYQRPAFYQNVLITLITETG